jgi:hypothetical protein
MIIEKIIEMINKISVEYSDLIISLRSLLIEDINKFNIKFIQSLEEKEKEWFYLQFIGDLKNDKDFVFYKKIWKIFM